MTDARHGPLIMGWREVAAMPDWGIKAVKAKVDTGARTSAIHVDSIEDLPDGRVRFEVVLREKPVRRTRVIEAEPVRRARVRPSDGQPQERLVFRTTLKIGPLEQEIEIGLVSRKGMLCRMLVGRRALPAGVVVDPNRKYLHGGVRVLKNKQKEDAP